MLKEASLAEHAGLTEVQVRSIVGEELEKGWKKGPATKKMAIIASKGTLDWAYPPLNLACTAAASGMEVSDTGHELVEATEAPDGSLTFVVRKREVEE